MNSFTKPAKQLLEHVNALKLDDINKYRINSVIIVNKANKIFTQV